MERFIKEPAHRVVFGFSLRRTLTISHYRHGVPKVSLITLSDLFDDQKSSKNQKKYQMRITSLGVISGIFICINVLFISQGWLEPWFLVETLKLAPLLESSSLPWLILLVRILSYLDIIAPFDRRKNSFQTITVQDFFQIIKGTFFHSDWWRI